MHSILYCAVVVYNNHTAPQLLACSAAAYLLQLPCLQAFAASSVVWCGQLPWRPGGSALALLAGINSRASCFPDTLFHATPYKLELRLLGTLADGEMLDGEVISAYTHALNARTSKLIRRQEDVPSVYFMSTHFMTKLLEGRGYNFSEAAKAGGASRRSMEMCGSPFDGILDYSMVVAPCHIKHPISPQLDHWVLTVADLERRTIQTIDPMMVSPFQSRGHHMTCFGMRYTHALILPTPCLSVLSASMLCTHQCVS
jgi:hypothetical protein